MLRELDRSAHGHRWAAECDALALFAAGLFVVASWSTARGQLVVLGVTTAVALPGLRLPWRVFSLTLAAPLAFLLPSTLLQSGSLSFHGYQPHWTFEPDRAWVATSLLLRSLALTSCTILFAAAVPVHRWLRYLRWARVPAPLVECLLLTYRWLLLLDGECSRLLRSARSRGGVGGLRPSLRSLSWGIAALLVRTQARAERLERALCARGYNGQLSWPDDRRSSRPFPLLLALLLPLLLAWASS